MYSTKGDTMWDMPYKISNNGTLTMKRGDMKKMTDSWLLDLYEKTVRSVFFGCGRLSKATEKSLILELRSRNLI
jgi:hypothetical protein